MTVRAVQGSAMDDRIPDDAIPDDSGGFIFGWGAWKGICPLCGYPMMPSISNVWIACQQGHVFELDKNSVKQPYKVKGR